MSNSTMPARVARIQRAIEEREDFTGLAHGGEDAVVQWAKTRGMNGRTLILEWQQAYRLAHVVAAGERGKKAGNLDMNSCPGLVEHETAVIHDLDYWSDTEPPDDDDDDPKICGACHGTGRDVAGNVCQACNGTGVAPDDGNGDEEDDDEREREDEE
jgi:hypothetical protein